MARGRNYDWRWDPTRLPSAPLHSYHNGSRALLVFSLTLFSPLAGMTNFRDDLLTKEKEATHARHAKRLLEIYFRTMSNMSNLLFTHMNLQSLIINSHDFCYIINTWNESFLRFVFNATFTTQQQLLSEFDEISWNMSRKICATTIILLQLITAVT